MAKTKALISCAVQQLICAFVFAYECCWFSQVICHEKPNFEGFRMDIKQAFQPLKMAFDNVRIDFEC